MAGADGERHWVGISAMHLLLPFPQDNRRANDLEVNGWHVLRFNGHQVREELEDYCVPKITEMVNRLDGLTDEGLVPRQLYHTSEGYAEQLRLFESPAEYDFD